MLPCSTSQPNLVPQVSGHVPWQTRQILVLGLAMGLLAVWNLPHTIALKHGLAVLLLIAVSGSRFAPGRFCRQLPWLVALFAYIVLHLLLLAEDRATAFDHFKGEWLKFILFALAGWGAGQWLRDRPPNTVLVCLGGACAVPLVLHLALALREGLATGAMPWGYWGLNEIHGDLGYAALCASLLLATAWFFTPLRLSTRVLVSLLLLACLLSPMLAQSRAGFAFVVVVLSACVTLWLVGHLRHENLRQGRALTIAVTLGVLAAAILMTYSADSERWSRMASRIELGLAADPLAVTCGGLPVLREALAAKGRILTSEQEQDLFYVADGDGLRALLLATGFRLVPQYPLGIDGAKDAYRIAIGRLCTPAIPAAHLHNGWLDTALAIGIPGALLYLAALLGLARQGWRGVVATRASHGPAIALFLMAVIWMVRALFDSTQRDQMLEMQIFLLTLLSAIALQKHQPASKPEA